MCLNREKENIACRRDVHSEEEVMSCQEGWGVPEVCDDDPGHSLKVTQGLSCRLKGFVFKEQRLQQRHRGQNQHRHTILRVQESELE